MAGIGGGGTDHNDGISLKGATVTATGGEISLRGDTTIVGRTSGSFDSGLAIRGTTPTAAGDLTLRGTGGMGLKNNRGVELFGQVSVFSGGVFGIIGSADAATTGIRNTGIPIVNRVMLGAV